MTSETDKKKTPAAAKRRRFERPQDLASHSRVFSILVHTLVQRLDRSRREVYGGDLDLASITEAIGLFASEGLMRDERWLEKYRSLDKTMGIDGQRVTNASSIAQATGIPRETTRRKLKKLMKLGVLTEVRPAQYVMTPGFLQRSDIQARYDNAFADVLRFINDGLAHGLFQLAEDDD